MLEITKPLINQHETHGADDRMARHGALLAQNADENLAAVIAAWPSLPEALRAGILAMVRAGVK